MKTGVTITAAYVLAGYAISGCAATRAPLDPITILDSTSPRMSKDAVRDVMSQNGFTCVEIPSGVISGSPYSYDARSLGPPESIKHHTTFLICVRRDPDAVGDAFVETSWRVFFLVRER